MESFFVREFNKRKRDIIWKKRGDSMKLIFREKLEVLEFKDTRNHSKQGIKSFEQVGIGYNGLGTTFMSGIQSEASVGLSSKDTVNDHLIGTTKIGEHVHKELIKSNYDIDWMVNYWLYDNLFLWAKIKLTKEEHHKDNVLRNSDHTIKQKLNLEHYSEKVSKLI